MAEAIRNLISILDMSVEEIDHLIEVADDIVANHDDYTEICRGKKLATLFFEPSTRTRAIARKRAAPLFWLWLLCLL